MGNSFVGTQRFSIVRELGAGGMGVVYAALDHERNAVVALKTLLALDADKLFRFKREFREFRTLQHPNLVALHELHFDAGLWFFTMDLIEGTDFLSWVRPAGVLDEARLRHALGQLAEALAALHDLGKVHRDVKPSNILVTAQGRLVLIDLGLASDALKRSTDAIMGTVAFMAPEQALGEAVGPAADSYSVGVMLYEALTGFLPSSGSLYAVLTSKLSRNVARPRSLDNAVPEDLDQLCVDLLARDPAQRPLPRSMLARALPPGRSSTAPAFQFVGRARELALLAQHLERSRRQFVTVALTGDSGIGKTTLLRRFADWVTEAHSKGVVLSSVCRECERLPFQALDGLVDALSSYLRRQPPELLAAILPAHVGLLAQLFPVLGRVPAIAEAAHAGERIPDAQHQRELSFSALRDLLRHLAAEQPVVLMLDDVHWLDADSAALLAGFHNDLEPARVLCLATLRTDASSTLELVTRMDQVSVERLVPEDATRLAQHLIGSAAQTPGVDAAALAEEAEGHPLFIDALARQAGRAGAASSLEQALSQALAELTLTARMVLEAACVAVAPVSSAIVAAAVDIARNDLDACSRELQDAHLLRCSGRDLLEPYHARVRSIVLGAMKPRQVQHVHERLARTIHATSAQDPETLAFHYLAAGNAEAAAEHLDLAAHKAARALAFDRAVQFYRQYLTLKPLPPRELWRRYAEALANAGRSAEAGQSYLRALQGAAGTEANELRRNASDQLIRAGLIDEGLTVLDGVLRSARLKLRGPHSSFASLLWARARLRVRGLSFVERPAESVSSDTLARIDAYSVVAISLSLTAPIQAASFQTRQLLLALDAGEPKRVALAMCGEAVFSAVGNRRARARSQRLFAYASELLDRIGEPELSAKATLAIGAAAAIDGRWQEAKELCARAEELLLGCRGTSWELASARWLWLWSSCIQGDISSLRQRLPSLSADAESRGDLYLSVKFGGLLFPFLSLIDGEPQRARDQVNHALNNWSRRGFHSQHMQAEFMLSQIDLYEGSLDAAAARITRLEAQLKRAHQWSVRIHRVRHYYLAGCAALRLGRSRLALRMANRLNGEGDSPADCFSSILRAGASTAEGAAGDTNWSRSAEICTASGMELLAACAQARAGDPTGLAWLEDRGVRNVAAVLDVFAPVLPRRGDTAVRARQARPLASS